MAVDIEKARAMLDHWESYAEAPWRYSSTTALMARETRDTIAALLDERDALAREVDACAAALPGPYYMDPPDGGDVPISEQVKRMARDAARYRWLRDNPWPDDLSEIIEYQCNARWDTAIDEAMKGASDES